MFNKSQNLNDSIKKANFPLKLVQNKTNLDNIQQILLISLNPKKGNTPLWLENNIPVIHIIHYCVIHKTSFEFLECVSQPNVTARTPARPAAPPAPTLPAVAAAAWAVEVEEGAQEEAEGAGAAAPAAPAARAASTTVTTWRPPTWRPQPSSTCQRVAGRCPMAWGGSPRTCARR